MRRERATYDYQRSETDPDAAAEPTTTRVDIEPDGTSYGAYLADRFRLLPEVPELVVELGLRWDRQSYVGARQLSPRLNLRYDVSPRTTLRAAWGRFTQPQRLNEVQVEDGVSELYPAQLAEHSLLGLEHRFDVGFAVRFEVYNKHLSELQPRFENLFDPLALFPEAAADRVEIAPDGGRARGLEVLVQTTRAGAVEWWASYVLSTVEDRDDGRWVPRSWDQRHALAAGLAWRLGSYDLGLAASWHTGWPITEVVPAPADDGSAASDLVLGARNGDRLPSYLRLDARASRSFATDHGEVALYFDVVNLSNRENACCRQDFAVVTGADGQPELSFDESHWVPIVPSFGVSWTF